ncbi:Hypothetical protein CINCED_3A021696 [Cinara cedri]|uniref:Uncharacterized protein n=1 Tax=Cinara cedri TaxID=506608 RepID=A0A5E4M6X6_9HEMI|nr:Hypothetical protein CINCED_3A021696 [Cinara cedri]
MTSACGKTVITAHRGNRHGRVLPNRSALESIASLALSRTLDSHFLPWPSQDRLVADKITLTPNLRIRSPHPEFAGFCNQKTAHIPLWTRPKQLPIRQHNSYLKPWLSLRNAALIRQYKTHFDYDVINVPTLGSYDLSYHPPNGCWRLASKRPDFRQ